MSVQTMDSLGPYKAPVDADTGIAGGSPTFARLQGGARRPIWMTAAPIAVIVVAAGAALYAISAAPPASAPAVTPAIAAPPAPQKRSRSRGLTFPPLLC